MCTPKPVFMGLATFYSGGSTVGNKRQVLPKKIAHPRNRCSEVTGANEHVATPYGETRAPPHPDAFKLLGLSWICVSTMDLQCSRRISRSLGLCCLTLRVDSFICSLAPSSHSIMRDIKSNSWGNAVGAETNSKSRSKRVEVS